MTTLKVCLLLLVGFCLQSCALENIPLKWRPTTDLYDKADTSSLSFLYSEKVKVAPFGDLRQRPNEIGKNIEKPWEKLVTTKDSVADWCTDRFKFSLSQFGVIPVETGETLIVKGDIVQFYVLEDTRYKGNVGIKLKIERPDSKLVWQGMMVGASQRFGRSYKDENYYEVLSDSFTEAFKGFIKNKAFTNELANK